MNKPSNVECVAGEPGVTKQVVEGPVIVVSNIVLFRTGRSLKYVLN